MLLRAKIQSGEQDLAAFESQLLEENGLQRAHSSPTLQDSSQLSQASSTQDGGNSSKASGCSGSKSRQEGQRHSYRQAVKKWGGAGVLGVAQHCTACGKLPVSLRKFFIWDPGGFGAPCEGGAGVRVYPTPSPKIVMPYPAPQSSRLAEMGWEPPASMLVQKVGWCAGGSTALQRPLRLSWARIQRLQQTGTTILHPFFPFSSRRSPLLLLHVLGPNTHLRQWNWSRIELKCCNRCWSHGVVTFQLFFLLIY